MTTPQMPALKVEVAFGSGFATPDTSRTWTDVTAYVELEKSLSISVGRQDEFATTDPNDLTLTFNNADGRFTPGNASSPYFPNVLLYVPIRVTATPVGGSPSVRFLGYVDEWPVGWRDIDLDSDVTITAHSRMARLGVEAPLKSDLDDYATTSGALAWWPLGEAAGAMSASERMGLGASALGIVGSGAALAFGSDVLLPLDGGTSVSFNTGSSTGQYLSGSLPLTPAGGFSVGFVVRGNGVSGNLLWLREPVSGMSLQVGAATASANVFAVAFDNGAAAASTPDGASVANGATHVVCVSVAIGGSGLAAGTRTYAVSVYVDGVLSVTASGSAPGALALPASPVFTITLAEAITAANIEHVMVWSNPGISAVDMTGATTAHAGEVSSARFGRWAKRGRVPATEIVAAGGTVMVGVDTAGMSVTDGLRNVETTEGGLMYDRPDGQLELQSRAHRYLAASAFTLDMALGHIEADYQPKLDGTMLVNDVTVANADQTISIETSDQASIDQYGYAAQSITTYATDPAEPQTRGQWLVNTYKEPAPRVSALTVDVLLAGLDGVSIAAMLGATVGDMFTVVNQPAQALEATSTYFIEGYTETIGINDWQRTFNVSPADIWLNALVLDDPVRGVIDSTNVLAY